MRMIGACKDRLEALAPFTLTNRIEQLFVHSLKIKQDITLGACQHESKRQLSTMGHPAGLNRACSAAGEAQQRPSLIVDFHCAGLNRASGDRTMLYQSRDLTAYSSIAPIKWQAIEMM
jgi:hypothetical protein